MSSTPSSSGKRKVEEGEEQRDQTDSKKPRRLNWSPTLHKQFVDAVNHLGGVKKAIPTKILELMNDPGLTREHVSSHLQKYRLHLHRIEVVSPPHQGNQNNNSLMTTGRDASFGPLSTLLNGSELQALPATAQSLTQRLAAGLIPPVMVSNTRFGDGIGQYHWQQPQPKPQVSLFHGLPIGIQQPLPMSIQHSKQLLSPHQGNQNNSFMTTGQDASFGPLSTLNGSELQALAASGQSLAHGLAAGPIPPVMVSNTRFGDGIGQYHWQQSQPQPQMSLHHDVLTDIQRQIPISMQQHIAADVQAGQCCFQNNEMLMPLGGQQPSLRVPPPMLPLSQSSISQAMLQTCYNNGAIQQQLPMSIQQQNTFQNSEMQMPLGGQQPSLRGPPQMLPLSQSSISQPMLRTGYNNGAIQHSSSSVAFDNFQPELPVNSFPQASTPTLSAPDWKATSYVEDVNSFEADFTIPNYDDIFTDDMFTKGEDDWDQPSFTELDTHQDSEESAVYFNPEAYSSSSMSRNNTTVAATEHGWSDQQPPPGMVLHHQVYAADEGGGSELNDD